eukprot:249826_1
MSDYNWDAYPQYLSKFKDRETLVILKPDVTIRGRPSALILQELLNKGYIPIEFVELQATNDLIQQHYKTTFARLNTTFINLICRFMTCGRIMVIKFRDVRGDGIVGRMRLDVGDCYVDTTISYSLRSKYLINDLISSIHSSDSDEEARREINIWQKYFNNTFDGMEDQKENIDEDCESRINSYIAYHRNDVCKDTKTIISIQTALKRSIRSLKYGADTQYNELENLRTHDTIKSYEAQLIEAFTSDVNKTKDAKELTNVMIDVLYETTLGFKCCCAIFFELCCGI